MAEAADEMVAMEEVKGWLNMVTGTFAFISGLRWYWNSCWSSGSLREIFISVCVLGSTDREGFSLCL